MAIEFGRRQFLNLEFAKRRGSQPPKRRGEPAHPSPQPPGEDIPSLITKRQVIVGGTVAVLGLVYYLRPWDRFFPSDDTLKAGWSKLGSLERIRRLEAKQYPGFSYFNAEQELISACADYYCQIVDCPPDIRQKVFFTDEPRIIEEIEADNGRKLTPEERKKYGGNTVEMVGLNSGLVLINRESLLRETNKWLRQPGVLQALGGLDPDTIFLKSTLFHAFSHASASQEQIAFDGIPVQTGGISTTYNRLEKGFVFSGARNGVRVFQSGGDEALTDYLGTAVGQSTGFYVSQSSYTSGVRLVEKLNLQSGVRIEDFIDYYTGRKPKKELFRRWGKIGNPGQPNQQAALKALLIIALRVDYPEQISEQRAIELINQQFKHGFEQKMPS